MIKTPIVIATIGLELIKTMCCICRVNRCRV